jgi:hypothetical protein
MLFIIDENYKKGKREDYLDNPGVNYDDYRNINP